MNTPPPDLVLLFLLSFIPLQRYLHRLPAGFFGPVAQLILDIATQSERVVTHDHLTLAVVQEA